MGESREGDVAGEGGDGGVSANDDFVVLAGAGCDEFQNVSAPVSAMTPVATARPSRIRVVRWCGRALSARRLPTARGLFARRRADIGSRAACAACSWLSVHEMTWIKGTQVRPTSSDR